MTGDKFDVTGDKFAMSGVAGGLQPLCHSKKSFFYVHHECSATRYMIYYTISVGKLFLKRSCRTRRQLEIFCSSIKRLIQIRCSSAFYKEAEEWQRSCSLSATLNSYVLETLPAIHRSNAERNLQAASKQNMN